MAALSTSKSEQARSAADVAPIETVELRAEQLYAMLADEYAALIEWLCRHLRARFGHLVVRRREATGTIDALSDALLRGLVERSLTVALGHGIAKARELTAFIVTRFVAAPNFAEHPAATRWLANADLDPNERLRQLLTRMTPKQWRDVRRAYRPEAWER